MENVNAANAPRDEVLALNIPPGYAVDRRHIEIMTRPNTDFWQKTWYGHSAASGHAVLFRLRHDEAVSVMLHFTPEQCFQQAGLMLYQDERHWVKFGLEMEADHRVKLGVTLTRDGHSDWNCQEIATPMEMARHLRIGLGRGAWRFFHRSIGPFGEPMRIAPAFAATDQPLFAGVFAASPGETGCKAVFTHLEFE
ncbi:DUF1349 domain-containing protein [Martelella alba]|nr:DUF1349 domain-containing protein [Martelella alba]